MSARKGDHGYAANWCIHYRGVTDEHGRDVTSCEAGVEGEIFLKVPFHLKPCFLDDKGRSKIGAVPCAHLRRPTPEEIDAHEVWSRARTRRLITVLAAIEPWREEHKGQSHAEVVECPICKGRLHLRIGALNGHVHSQCETEDCVSWVE